MLKKLRRKFVLITMTLITVILLAVFGAGIGSTYQQSFSSLHDSLVRAATRTDESGLMPQIGELFGFNFDEGGTPPEAPPEGSTRGAFIPVYTVTVDALQQITPESQYTTMNENLVVQAVQEVSVRAEQEGYLNNLELYYYRSEASALGEVRIAFADVTNVRDPLLNQLRISLLIGVAAWLAFLAASVLLSRIALRPVEAAWQQQRRFIADASHELKTPLTVILANNDILLSSPEKSAVEQRKWLLSTEDEAERMKGLVNDLLTLAQLEEDEKPQGSSLPLPPTKTEVNLSDIVGKSALQFEAVAFERRVRIEEEIDSGTTVQGNAEELERLVKIVLDNACKYANEGGLVAVRLHKVNAKAELQIANTGDPIAQGDEKKIFERFYRVDESRTRSGEAPAQEGYGLGLSIAHAIVEKHGGSITAASAEGVTTFTIILK